MDNTLSSRCYAITMILRVRRNFFEITTFPNMLFKGAEAPASATEDRGFSSQRPTDEVSYVILYGTLAFHVLTSCGI